MGANTYIRVATPTINGVNTAPKKEELALIAKDSKWDIILLQETRIKADAVHDFRLHGYTTVHHPEEATQARRGVATYLCAVAAGF